jgi:hypothetical protein
MPTTYHALGQLTRLALLPSLLLLQACGGDSGGETASSPPATISPTPAPSSPAPLDATTLPPDAAAATVTLDNSMPARARAFIAGVGTHFALSESRGYENDGALSAMQKIGFTSFRDDIYWNVFAPSWDLQGANLAPRLDSFIKASTARPFLILNNGNPLIPDAMPPLTDAARAEFAAFALRAVKATAGKGALYELWNEWNLRGAGEISGSVPMVGAGDGTDPRSAVHYAALAHKVVDVLKASDPTTEIVVGGTADDPDWTWTKAVIGTGIMRKADGYSVHLYNHCNVDPWRGAANAIQYLEDLQVAATQANGGVEVPIYVSEYSWPTGTNRCALAPDIAAAYAAQFMLYSAARPWVRGSWFYELLDSGPNPADIEDNFGLLYTGYREKPSACQLRESISLIQSAAAMAAEQPKKGLFVIKMRTATGMKIIAWTRVASQTASLRVGGTAPFTAHRLCDDSAQLVSDRIVQIGLTPVVVSIDNVQAAAIQIKEN